MSERDIDNAMLMGKILAKLDAIERKLESFTGEISKLEDRVTTLEAFRYKLLGICSVVSVIVGLAISYLKP